MDFGGLSKNWNVRYTNVSQRERKLMFSQSDGILIGLFIKSGTLKGDGDSKLYSLVYLLYFHRSFTVFLVANLHNVSILLTVFQKASSLFSFP